LVRPVRLGLLLLVVLGLGLAGAGCGLIGGSSHHAAQQTQPTVKAAPPPTSTTVPGVQTSGPRTVLSPIGLHVRATPSLSARVLGTAAQGVVLEVLGQTDQAGGWYRVKGATLTGWITGNPSLSAPGTFRNYNSVAHQFQALFPLQWSVVDSPAASIFRAPRSLEEIVVTTAPSVTKLDAARPGYHEIRTETLVACGVTGDLVTYAADGPPVRVPLPYYARIRLALDRQHALGIAALLPDVAALQQVRNLANSITFPFPECEG
jgi:hypothetical protein